jgi:hypothetical protein
MIVRYCERAPPTAPTVMAGLVPAAHAAQPALPLAGRDDAGGASKSTLLPRVYGRAFGLKKERELTRVDGRDKPGHDEEASA